MPKYNKTQSRGVMVYYAIGWIPALFVPASWATLKLFVAIYFARMFLVTGVHHRYFAHRTYSTSRPFQFILGLLAETCMQQGVIWWAATHRHHHKFCDTEHDAHSASVKGFLQAHCGWIHEEANYDMDKLYKACPDLTRFPELVWLDELYAVPPLALGALMYYLGGWEMFWWCWFINTWALSHGTFLVNSAVHLWGTERYTCQFQDCCTAKNNWWVSILTMGEGWHNNHHAQMGSCRQGIMWWEYDPTYYILRLMQCVGLIWDIREPDMKRFKVKENPEPPVGWVHGWSTANPSNKKSCVSAVAAEKKSS